MARSIKSLRTFARALHNTVKRLEQDPDVDPTDPAFLSLKFSMLSFGAELLERASELEASGALTALPEPESQPTAPPADKAD